MPRILQLTDLHLFANPNQRLKNVPTWATFRDVCEHIRANAANWDLLVITGDLAHDELAETYELLRQELADWLPRFRIIPGNHDNRTGLKQVFPEVIASEYEFLSFAELLGDWLIVGLDTHQPGEVSGRIEAEQIEWFRRQLAAHRENPTLVFLHHPPVSVNSTWLDEIGLEDPEPLQEIIKANPQIRAVTLGHVHHVFEGKLGTAAVLTTPSTAIQFEPRGEESSYVNDPPGYRVFDLDGQVYRTEIVRLPELRFPARKDE